jgi:hypothetical protein
MGVDTIIADIENKLYRSVFYSQGENFYQFRRIER